MEEADKVAIARVVIRSKQSLVAIRAKDNVLMMETMLFADEIVPTDSIEELARWTARRPPSASSAWPTS